MKSLRWHFIYLICKQGYMSRYMSKRFTDVKVLSQTHTRVVSPVVCQHFLSCILTTWSMILCLFRQTCSSEASVDRLRLLAPGSCHFLLPQISGCSSSLKTLGCLVWQVMFLRKTPYQCGSVPQALVLSSQFPWASFPAPLHPANFFLHINCALKKQSELHLSPLPVLASINYSTLSLVVVTLDIQQ